MIPRLLREHRLTKDFDKDHNVLSDVPLTSVPHSLIGMQPSANRKQRAYPSSTATAPEVTTAPFSASSHLLGCFQSAKGGSRQQQHSWSPRLARSG